jgi:hypothetical protein
MEATYGMNVLIGMNPIGRADLFPVRLRLEDGRVNVDKSRDCPAELNPTTSPERKEERKKFREWLRPFVAMSKIMEPPRSALYLRGAVVKEAYITKELFDPTTLCEYIIYNGVTKVVDAVFPLGDVANYNESFKEIA